MDCFASNIFIFHAHVYVYEKKNFNISQIFWKTAQDLSWLFLLEMGYRMGYSDQGQHNQCNNFVCSGWRLDPHPWYYFGLKNGKIYKQSIISRLKIQKSKIKIFSNYLINPANYMYLGCHSNISFIQVLLRHLVWNHSEGFQHFRFYLL